MMMTRTRNKSEARFNQLVQEHGERIYNLALLKCGASTLAEDVCQETFIRIFKGLPRFRSEADIGTWIYRIALNVCYSTLKRELKGRRQEVHLEDSEIPDLAAEDSDVPMLQHRADQSQRIRKAIAALPGPQADAISLYYLNDLKYTEIAAIMELPINTVKSHLRRGKESLRRLIPEEEL